MAALRAAGKVHMPTRSFVPRHAADSPADSDAQTGSKRGIARAAGAVVATLGAAAVATAAMATPADAAAKFAVWDRVASCESSNNWHINTGNGFYGGLQFTAGTWAAYGGHRYAWQANGASRLQQIEVARRVLASQGPGAWPVCGPRAGLTRRDGHATSRPLPANPRRAESKHHRRLRAVHHVRHHAHGFVRYRVRPGDTLAKIARRHHVAGGWRHLFRINRDRIHNPNALYAGEVIRLP